jgi:hypothetical protein
MRKVTFLGVAMLAVALAQVSNAANLILNGGFELTNNSFSQTQTPVDWTNVGHTDGVIAYSVFATPAYDGLYYYDLGGYGGALPGSGDGIEQTVATSIGTQYTLTFGLSNENYTGYGPEFLNVLINGTLQQSYLMVYDNTFGGFQNPFVTQTLSYTADSTSSTILFTVTGSSLGGQDPLIDGISFDSASGVPEPATWLTALAGLTLGALRFRKSVN